MSTRDSPRDVPIRQRALRAHNLAVVLRQVAARPGGVSRAAIAAHSGLTKATVSAIVDELVAGGLATFAESIDNGTVGRPAPRVTLAGARPVGLGMEINVDYLAACLLDLSGAVRHREVLDSPPLTPADAMNALESLAEKACTAAQAEDLTIAGGVVALPGLVEGHTVHLAPNLDWHEVTLPTELSGVDIRFGNEANLAALGELHATGLPNFLYVSGEIGIGAGIVYNHQALTGTRGWAGELGHVTVDPGGRPCRCGSNGCLEQYAGKHTLRSAEEAVGALGIALSGALNLLDVPTVVLGGHLAPLAPLIDKELGRRVLTAKWAPPTIRASALGSDAAIIGAARTVTQAIIDDPAAYLMAQA